MNIVKYKTDSRKVCEGDTFIAICGYTVDGHDYINDAILNGASKIVSEKDINVNVPIEIVKSTREYLKDILKEEYSDKINNNLKIVGITGTNGKTTTAYLCYQLLNYLGINSAYLGTLGYKSKDKEFITSNTTPDILTIYNILLDAIDDNIQVVVMEVSSHALSYERIYGLKLYSAIFTNLTEDHLDYHKDMDNYLMDKLKIIDYLSVDGNLIVNGDDDSSKKFISKFGRGITVGFDANNDYYIKDINITPIKTDIKFVYKEKEYNVNIPLANKFNVYNYMMALALLHEYDYDIMDIISQSNLLVSPPGRCELYKVGEGYAIIDYAHTPDAVEKVITSYNEIKKGKVITIIGCGGDRDPIKRPIMGDIATKLSDYVIFTSDNPRTEDPEKILEDILKGVKSNNYQVETDRKLAIKRGIDLLKKDDILLILGKGHEDYQIIGHNKIHLDDREEVMKYIK